MSPHTTRANKEAFTALNDLLLQIRKFAPAPAFVRYLEKTAVYRKHVSYGSSFRGILGGYNVRCSCGGSWIELDGVVPICGVLEQALAAAREHYHNNFYVEDDSPEEIAAIVEKFDRGEIDGYTTGDRESSG